jgi:hypothetical protein
MKVRAALWLGGLLAASTAGAQGDFLFDRIPGLTKEPTVQIDLNEAMIKLFAGAASGQHAEAATALSGITNLRVRVYEDISAEIPDVMKFVNETTTRLEGDGWNSIVRVNDGDEQVRVYVKPGANSTIAGLTVMVTDGGSDGDGDGDGVGGEAVFINVSGVIQPAQLGALAGMGMHGAFNGFSFPGAGDANPNTRD